MASVTRQAAYLKKKKSPSVSYKWVNWVLPLIVFFTLIYFTKDFLNNPTTLPINKIRVHGAFVNVDEAMLHRAVSNEITAGYFNVDVGHVRKVVEDLPWVNKASVRRVWPDTLSVNVVEQKPVAISKDNGLINKNGKTFKPLNKIVPKNLPVFDGDAKLNKLMLSKYFEMNELLATINLKISYLKVDARHAVELMLGNGLKIVLGREDNLHRLKRLMLIYNKMLASRINDIDVIDLRYTNGLAIGWKKSLHNKNGRLGDMKNV